MISEFPKPARLPHPVKITEQMWPEWTVPLVSIKCITYNHVNFIREAIDGFLMQETTFPVEILIHDDASTDGTADIVREYQAKYPQLIRTVLQTENQWSKGIKPALFINQMTRGEFIALCEGDDYWTSPRKLDKQVRVLEQDPSAALVFHNALLTDDCVGAASMRPMHKDLGKTTFETKDLLCQWFIPTASIVYRNYPDFEMPGWFARCQSGDIPLLLLLSLRGTLHYLPDPMSVYRLHAGGVSKTHFGHSKVLAMTYVYQCFNQHTDYKYEPLINEAILYEIRTHMPECQAGKPRNALTQLMSIYYRCRITGGAFKKWLTQQLFSCKSKSPAS